MTCEPKNKRLTQIVSIFLGVLLIFLCSSVILLSAFFFEPNPENSFVKEVFLNLAANLSWVLSGLFFLTLGILLLIPRFRALVAIVSLPFTCLAWMFSGLPVLVLLVLAMFANVYLIYAYKALYRGIIVASSNKEYNTPLSSHSLKVK